MSDDSFRQRAKTYASPRQTGSGGPKTLADYQQLTAKAKVAAQARVRSPEDEEEGGGKSSTKEIISWEGELLHIL